MSFVALSITIAYPTKYSIVKELLLKEIAHLITQFQGISPDKM